MTDPVADLDPCVVAAVDGWRAHARGDYVAVDEAEPWALPMVVRAEKDPAPDHLDTLEAAARAVVLLLADPRCAPGGDWHAPLARWADGRIRKVSRRARGAKWTQAAQAAQVVVEHASAAVAVLLPTPAAAPPAAVAKLQVSGLELDTAATDRPVLDSRSLRVFLAPQVTMSTGKASAQVGHAAQLALLTLPRKDVLAFLAAGAPIRVDVARPSAWAALTAPGRHDVAVVADAGFTEVAPGTVTCLATFSSP